MSQLAMSERYYKAVTEGGDFEALVREWYAGYDELLPEGYKPSSTTYEAAKGLLGEDSPYTKMVGVIDYYDFSWEKFVTAMIQKYNGGPLSEELKDGGILKDATYLFNTAAPFNSITGADKEYTLLKPNRKKMQPNHKLLAATYVIPKRDETLLSQHNRWLFSGRDAGDIGYRKDSNSENKMFSITDASVSIEKVVSASSAAGGLLSSPKMLAQLTYFAGSIASNFPDISVLVENSGTGINLIDGAYADNSGVAAGISFAQRGGAEKDAENPLRFLVLDNGVAGDCSSSVPFLFLHNDATMDEKVKLLVARVFKESWGDVKPKFKSVDISLTDGDLAPTWARLTLETIDNDNFGVQGGWPVELFVILQNSKSDTILVPRTNNEGYIRDALNMHAAFKSLESELKSFFGK